MPDSAYVLYFDVVDRTCGLTLGLCFGSLTHALSGFSFWTTRIVQVWGGANITRLVLLNVSLDLPQLWRLSDLMFIH